MTETVERLSWSMVKFTGLHGGPVYIDLRQVACVTEAKAPGELAALGARVILISGIAIYTRESAGTVFEEVHRANTQKEPAAPAMKVSGAAPAAVVPVIPPAPIAQGPVYCAHEACYIFWSPDEALRLGAEFIDGRWLCALHKSAAGSGELGEEAGRATQAPAP